jgi:hypothetical protein
MKVYGSRCTLNTFGSQVLSPFIPKPGLTPKLLCALLADLLTALCTLATEYLSRVSDLFRTTPDCVQVVRTAVVAMRLLLGKVLQFIDCNIRVTSRSV